MVILINPVPLKKSLLPDPVKLILLKVVLIMEREMRQLDNFQVDDLLVFFYSYS